MKYVHLVISFTVFVTTTATADSAQTAPTIATQYFKVAKSCEVRLENKETKPAQRKRDILFIKNNEKCSSYVGQSVKDEWDLSFRNANENLSGWRVTRSLSKDWMLVGHNNEVKETPELRTCADRQKAEIMKALSMSEQSLSPEKKKTFIETAKITVQVFQSDATKLYTDLFSSIYSDATYIDGQFTIQTEYSKDFIMDSCKVVSANDLETTLYLAVEKGMGSSPKKLALDEFFEDKPY